MISRDTLPSENSSLLTEKLPLEEQRCLGFVTHLSSKPERLCEQRERVLFALN